MASRSSSSIRNIANDKEFKTELALQRENLVVVGFFEPGLGPSAEVIPKFEELSKSDKCTGAIFWRVDVSLCSNTAKNYSINRVPTFGFFHNNQKLDQVVGVDLAALESGIIRHLSSTVTQSVCDSGDIASKNIEILGQVNLNTIINLTGSECLNELDTHNFKNALNHSSSYLESDCDEQLIIALSFIQPVKLHTLQLVCPEPDKAPKVMKLFINQIHTMDFDTAETATPIQQIELTPEDVSLDNETGIPLKYLKFQNVQNLMIFIQNNQGGEETTLIQYIGLYGNLIDSTNMKDFKRVAGDKGERH